MKILIVQNRKGIGDMVIFLPYIEAISKKFGTPVSILVKENSKAYQILNENKHINKIINLDRDNKGKEGRHDGIRGSFNLAAELKKYNFDKIFIFNSSLRFYLIAKMSGIKSIYQYPLFEKKNQHIIETAQNFLKKNLNINVTSKSEIKINFEKANLAKMKYKILENETNVLLGIGGSGKTKRVPAKIFINFMKYSLQKFNCRFFLATGQKKEEQEILQEILNSEFKNKCVALDNLSLEEIMPIIKNCNISVCNDSSFSHLSAAIEIPTIVLMADTPLIYGSYSPNMHPIIPEGEETVKHNTLGKNKINPEKIYIKFKDLLN